MTILNFRLQHKLSVVDKSVIDKDYNVHIFFIAQITLLGRRH